MHIKRKKLVDPVVIRVACFCFCFGNTLDYNFDRNYRTYKLLWYKGQAWIIKSRRPRLKVEEPDKKSSGKTKSEGVNWLVRFFFSVINKTKGTLSQQNGEPAPPPSSPPLLRSLFRVIQWCSNYDFLPSLWTEQFVVIFKFEEFK